MEKLRKLLDSLNLNKARTEIDAQGKIKSSNEINNALRHTYKDLPTSKSSRVLLLNVWTSVVSAASNSRDGKITREWIKLLNSLDKVVKVILQNENSSEAAFVQFRKPIKTKYGDKSEIYKQSLYLLGVSQERSKQRKEAYSAEVKVRNSLRGKMKPIYVEDVLEIIQKLKVSNNPYEQTLAVMLATGARSIEVFKVSTFKSTDVPMAIHIKGIAKDRSNNNLQNVVVIRDLVGLNGDEVCELVDDIRNTINVRGTNREIADRTNMSLNKVAAKWLNRELKQAAGKKITAHKCRYIYGNVAFLLYGEPNRTPYESYIQEQLAHLSGESTKSYLGINIQFKNKVIQSAPEELKQVFTNEIEKLKKQIDTQCRNPISLNENIDLSSFKNSHRRNVSHDEKVGNVVSALKMLKEKNIKTTQKELRALLGYSSDIMCRAYTIFRGPINDLNEIGIDDAEL